jgi:hypothetical protein
VEAQAKAEAQRKWDAEQAEHERPARLREALAELDARIDNHRNSVTDAGERLFKSLQADRARIGAELERIEGRVIAEPAERSRVAAELQRLEGRVIIEEPAEFADQSDLVRVGE